MADTSFAGVFPCAEAVTLLRDILVGCCCRLRFAPSIDFTVGGVTLHTQGRLFHKQAAQTLQRHLLAIHSPQEAIAEIAAVILNFTVSAFGVYESILSAPFLFGSRAFFFPNSRRDHHVREQTCPTKGGADRWQMLVFVPSVSISSSHSIT